MPKKKGKEKKKEEREREGEEKRERERARKKKEKKKETLFGGNFAAFLYGHLYNTDVGGNKAKRTRCQEGPQYSVCCQGRDPELRSPAPILFFFRVGHICSHLQSQI